MEPRTTASFLELVDREVVRLGPRDHLAVERLLRVESEAGELRRRELRAALASVLARDREQWERITKLYDQYLKKDELDSGKGPIATDGGEQPRTQVVQLNTPKPPSSWQRLRKRFGQVQGKTIEKLRAAPRSWWMLGIILVLAGIVALPLRLWLFPETPQQVPVAGDASVASPPPEVGSDQEFQLVRLQLDEIRNRPTVTKRPPAPSVLTLAGLVLLASFLVALGIRFVWLPEAEREQAAKRRTERRERTDTERAHLEAEKAASGAALKVRYHVEQHLPVSRQTVLDSAELLGRLFRSERGIDLDAGATLDHTVAAGGRFIPVLAPRFSRQEILVLASTESGDHPFLGAFRRLLDAWGAQGLSLLVYEFAELPDVLIDSETRESIVIDELARRHEGLPLILFSRTLDLDARRGGAAWPNQLAMWPQRAWLDPNPRPVCDLPRGRRRIVTSIEERLGLPRFRLSNEGVVLLARHLASHGGAAPRATEASLPTLSAADKDRRLTEALRKWALAGSLVPDPNWDQLEAIRRHFSELHQHLPEPAYLQLLLEWVEQDTKGRAELSGGRGLAISEDQQKTWQATQRRRAKEDPEEADFEARVRQLLLDQLGSDAPKDPLDAEWWKFKRAMHQAMLEPERAAEFLSWIGESAIAHEALRWLGQQIDLEESGVGIGMAEADRESLSAMVDQAWGIPIRSLLVGHLGRVWRPAILFSCLCGLSIWLLLPSFAEDRSNGFETAIELGVGDPLPVFKLVESTNRPVMIDLPGGSFMMGSDEITTMELPVHQVEIAPFQISKTEVTVAHYQACIEVGFCKEPRSHTASDTCNWQADGRDDHPINCVSWGQARTYAEWLGARLPSEAEWEYAARSAGLDRDYPWGNEEADCGWAIVRIDDNSGCGKGSTWPVCSRTAGNTDQGLCDMAANVWEWVEDDWRGSYEAAPADGNALVDSPRAYYRVIRGGSWRDYARFARVANRFRDVPSYRSVDVGFRVARSLHQ
ncbi:MAG: formylglycine-generating enzyme family protein [Acidobacteriota bacterium]